MIIEWGIKEVYMLPDEVLKLLKKYKFVTIATSSLKARPNAAPKFLLEVEDEYIYVVDYYVNRTWRNLAVNPKIVVSLFDEKLLKGYQIKGTAKVLSPGEEYDRLKKLLDEKISDYSIDRVIEAVRSGVKNESYEISMPARIVILKIKVTEISINGITGKIKKESVGRIKVPVEKEELKTDVPVETIPLLMPEMLENVSEELTTVSLEEVKNFKNA